MNEEDQTLPTQEIEGGSNEGTQSSDDVSMDDLFEDNQVDVSEVNEALGRTGENAFKSKDDVIKHIKNVNKYVGENEYSKKAKEAEEFQAKMGMSPSEFLQKNQTPQPQRDDLQQSDRGEIQSLKQDVTKILLLNAHPEAVHVLDEVRAAKYLPQNKGKSEIEIFEQSENLKLLASTLHRKETHKKQVTPPSARIRVGEKTPDDMSLDEIKANFNQLKEKALAKNRR